MSNTLAPQLRRTAAHLYVLAATTDRPTRLARQLRADACHDEADAIDPPDPSDNYWDRT
jgi:hypothetical protein